MSDAEEFAEEYSTSERIRIVVFGIVAGAVLVAVGNLWFFPWLREFSESAACRAVFGLDGSVVLFYGLFAGLPLTAAIGIALSFGRRGFRILKQGQVPPRGEKVFRPTRIEKGGKAKLVGTVQLLAVLPPLALVIWGIGQAEKLAAETPAKPRNCPVLAVDHHQ